MYALLLIVLTLAVGWLVVETKIIFLALAAWPLLNELAKNVTNTDVEALWGWAMAFAIGAGLFVAIF